MELDQQPETEITTPTPTPTKPRGRTALIALIIILIIGGAFRLGYVAGVKGYQFQPQNFKVINRGDQPANVDYSLLWKALDIINQKYIDRDKIDQQKVLYGAIQGAVTAAGDDYTEFFDPQALAAFREELQGSFSGIGAEIGTRDNNIVIVAPLEGNPAEKAGVLAQDVILAVDGQSVVGLAVDEVVSKIRGPEGTDVTLTLSREGRDSSFDVTIKRQKIDMKSLKYEIREVDGKQVAIITLSRFGDDTKDLFDKAVKEIVDRKVSGIILDLRNNPGGYLDTSVELASDWLANGELVVKEEHSQTDAINYNSLGYNRLGNIKTVTLINGGSASAAEILSGALRDHNKTTLIGEKSFGKGSVQELVPLSTNMAVKVTVAKWITPGGRNLNHDGLQPDIEVKLSEDDVKADRDPQLDRALQEVVK